jgi:hypothetical protein
MTRKDNQIFILDGSLEEIKKASAKQKETIIMFEKNKEV